MADVELGRFRSELEQLGKGGLGTAYRVKYFRLPNAPFELVYKEYRDQIQARDESVLRSLIDARNTMPAADRTVLDRSTSWPLALVRDEGRTTGFLMRRAPASFRYAKRGDVRWFDNQLDLLFQSSDKTAKLGASVPGDTDLVARVRLCLSLAETFAVLHRNGLVYGDLSHKNALFTLDPQPEIYLIDCDAIREASDHRRVQAHTITWTPPDLGAGDLQDASSDAYKLALFVLRCVAPGAGVGMQKTSHVDAAGYVNSAALKMLERGLGRAPDRPNAEEWRRFLHEYLADLTAPPKITWLDVSDDFAIAGDPLSLSWSTTGAQQVSVSCADGRVIPVGPTGSMLVSAVVPGPIHLTARNPYGAASAATAPIRVVTPPVVERMAVPEPAATAVNVWDLSELSHQVDLITAAAGASARSIQADLPRITLPEVHPPDLPAMPDLASRLGISTRGLNLPFWTQDGLLQPPAAKRMRRSQLLHSLTKRRGRTNSGEES